MTGWRGVAVLICCIAAAFAGAVANGAVIIDDFTEMFHIALPEDQDKYVTTSQVGPFDTERRASVFAHFAEPIGVFDAHSLHPSTATLIVESVNPTSFVRIPVVNSHLNYSFSNPVDLTQKGTLDAILVDFSISQGPIPPQRLRLLVHQDVSGRRSFWEQSFPLSDERLEPFTAVFPFAAFFSRGGGPFAPPFISVPDFEATFLNLGEENGQWEIRLESIRIGALPGADYNGNGHVEQGDLDLVLLHWGDPALPAPLGWYHDLPQGVIDQSELDHVLMHWGGQIEPPGVNATEARIPEPTAALLMVVAGGVMIVGRGLKQSPGRVAAKARKG